MVFRRQSGVDKASKERVQRRVAGLKRGLFLEGKKALQKHGQRWYRQMADQFRAPLVPYGQVNSNRTLHNRTNALRGSLTWGVDGTRVGNLALKLKSSSPYAPMQEFGGEIRPKRARFLAIPIDEALFPAGGRKYASPEQFRNDPDVRFLRTKSGKLYLVRDRYRVNAGRGAAFVRSDVEFLFAFRKSVDIPGPESKKRKIPSRLGFRENAIGSEARKRLLQRMAVGVRNALRAQVSSGA